MATAAANTPTTTTAGAEAEISFMSWLSQDRLERDLKCKLDRSLELDDQAYNAVAKLLPAFLVRRKSPPVTDITVPERQMCLELVHTLCVVHPKSRQYFGSHQYVEALVGFLRIDALQVSTLQALEGALVDSKDNQERTVCRGSFSNQTGSRAIHRPNQSFERLAGLKIICGILNNRKAPPLARVKAAEFLYLFLSPDQDEQAGDYNTIASEDDLSERARNVSGYIGLEQLFMLLNLADLEDLEATCAVVVYEMDKMRGGDGK